MIFERDRHQQLSLEKMLNGLGYYAVTTMSSAAEVFSVLTYASTPFDLIIANGTLSAAADIDFTELCKRHPFFRHALVYDCPRPVFTSSADSPGLVTQSSSTPPDSQSILSLMQAIDRSSFVHDGIEGITASYLAKTKKQSERDSRPSVSEF
jgi:hypothetical protein